MLDLACAWQVMSAVPGATCHAVWNRSGPIMADGGLELVTSRSFENSPDFDVLVVPGGPGQQSLMRHVPLMEFLRSRASSDRLTAGIGSGVLLLGQAGLLKGRRVSALPGAERSLAAFGASVSGEEHVIDANLATCAGAHAAIELSLVLVGRLAGDQAAAAVREAIA